MEKFKPFVATRNSDYGAKGAYLAVEPAGAVALLHYRLGLGRVDVMVVTNKLASEDWTCQPTNPADQARAFKAQALTDGATPEAIRLLGTLIPLTTKETNIMAEKLKAKGPDKAALAAAAKKAPVAGKGAAAAPKKNPGNAAALAKAREAQKVNKKYKPLVKAKDELVTKLRGWTAFMVGVIIAHKDTDSAKATMAATKGEYAGRNLDFTWAAKKGFISTPTA